MNKQHSQLQMKEKLKSNKSNHFSGKNLRQSSSQARKQAHSIGSLGYSHSRTR